MQQWTLFSRFEKLHFLVGHGRRDQNIVFFGLREFERKPGSIGRGEVIQLEGFMANSPLCANPAIEMSHRDRSEPPELSMSAKTSVFLTVLDHELPS